VFKTVILCETLKIDYWTLMIQPKKFIDLFEIYLLVSKKIRQEEENKINNRLNRSKVSRYGR